MRGIFDDLPAADGKTVGIAGIPEEDGKLAVPDAGIRAAPKPPFLNHDSAFSVDLRSSSPGRPVSRMRKAYHNTGAVGTGHIYGLVVPV